MCAKSFHYCSKRSRRIYEYDTTDELNVINQTEITTVTAAGQNAPAAGRTTLTSTHPILSPMAICSIPQSSILYILPCKGVADKLVIWGVPTDFDN
mmetsp:Transcript_17425/g.27329  ORF Transcript_17425/g.27329 Transcript_17425/m.27329 type:complete len:96 (+) Transcript_17425:827-1114(+)